MEMTNLENSDQFFYSLVENIPQAIFCKDLDGRFTFANEIFCRFLRTTTDEILGKTDFDYMAREQAEKFRTDDAKVMESGTKMDIVEKNVGPEGDVRYVHVIKTSVQDAKGSTIGIQGIFMDITQSKIQEEELKSSHERMKRELQQAAHVQTALLPQDLPQIEGFNFAFKYIPWQHVGGDMYNVFPSSDDRWGFYLLDVSGHGVSAALLSTSLSRILLPEATIREADRNERVSEAVSSEFLDPASVVDLLREHFPLPVDTGMYSTLLYAVVNPQESSVTWIRAAHEPPILYRRSSGKAYLLEEPACSIISSEPFEGESKQAGHLTMESGDRLIVFSDGIREIKNREGEEFGYKRIAKCVRDSMDRPLEQCLDAIVDSAHAWSDQDHFSDDVTMVGLERD